MPSRNVAACSACRPTMNPGTSTRKMIGMWKVSQSCTKCVCLRAAFTSMAPPFTIGLLAITPTTLPFMRASAVITLLARMNGKVVGVIANNPMVYGGAMDAKAARKQTHFVQLCDTFHIPIIFFVDVPGFMVGLQAEQAATLREGMRSVYVGLQASVPMLTVVIRKCYGMAGMGTTDKNGLDFKIAWPSAEWGSLPVEGGAAAAFKREIESASDPRKRLQEIEAELRTLASPLLTAEAFAVEDIIDPRETRPYLCHFIDAMQGRLATNVGIKKRAGVPP